METPSHTLLFDRVVPSIVGNGRTVVNVRAGHLDFIRGAQGAARFVVRLGGKERELAEAPVQARYFPGGIEFVREFDGTALHLLHGANPETGYFSLFRATGPLAASLEVELAALPSRPLIALQAAHSAPSAGEALVAFTHGAALPTLDYAAVRDALQAPYSRGLVLRSPSARLDRAVAFSQQLVDLSFDGNLMVCEINRWQDVWARDLATGLMPGALWSGRPALGQRSLDYDLARYARTKPEGYKNQDDTSKGGSIDGVSWTLVSMWQFYVHGGDRDYLARAFDIMRPWVARMIERDHDDDGLVVDLTEHLDHMINLLTPDSVSTLCANSLFGLMLLTAARIERELGDSAAAERYETLHTRTVRAINTRCWDEHLGCYTNLLLSGETDHRINQTYHGLVAYAGAMPRERALRSFATLERVNWAPGGSITITPRMMHVDMENDQNVKVWPWWNLWEADARYTFDDARGAYHLLDLAAATTELPDHPGFVKETLEPDGRSVGGKVFVTGAGAFLQTLVTGLLGVTFADPSRARVRPQVPAGWTDYAATIPTAGGRLELVCTAGRLRVTVHDPRVKSVEVPAGVEVVGAQARPLTAAKELSLADATVPVAPVALPAPRRARRAAVLVQPGLPNHDYPGLPSTRIDVAGLDRLAASDIDYLVIPGNAVPYRTASGADTRAVFEAFLARGGSLVLHGVTTSPRGPYPGKGMMAEQGGLFEWYDHLPVRDTRPITGWQFAKSTFWAWNPNRAPHDPALARGWHQTDGGDAPWMDVDTSRHWSEFDKEWVHWGWYRASFDLPADFEGKPVELQFGPVEDFERVFVNGEFVGDHTSQRTVREYMLGGYNPVYWDQTRTLPRLYILQPGTEAYRALRFGARNRLTLQVNAGWMGGGFISRTTPTVGVSTAELAWQPCDLDRPGHAFPAPRRKGVNYWGQEEFFNSWETRRGAFGFKIEGDGVQFASDGPLADLPGATGAVGEAFTDFSVFKPWCFQPIAWTRTQGHLLHPDNGERYACAARLVNRDNGGEIILVGRSLAQTSAGPALLARLGVK